MLTFDNFKEDLLRFLFVEKTLEKRDILQNSKMPREEKINIGIMVPDLSVTKSLDDTYVFKTTENYSKLRSGDSIILKNEGEEKTTKGVVIDTDQDTITIRMDKEIDAGMVYDLEIVSPDLLNSLKGCLEGILPATPGAAFLRYLSGEKQVVSENFLALKPVEINGFEKTFSSLSLEQKQAVESMLEYYPIHVLQGPPGTGKTVVLAATAIVNSLENREVVVIANTHQAVNNALMKVRQLNKNIPLFKIGDLLKADGLDSTINKFGKFADYNEYSRTNRKKKRYGYVIGMTIWGAVVNLGLRTHSHFRPYMALVDEASLMPLTYASILGKCSSAICFFGDSRQMSPIFRPEMKGNPLAVSILDYCAYQVEGVPVCVLPETHRMNKEITTLVSRSFYEPHGITLRSAKDIADNIFISPYMDLKGLIRSVSFASPELSTSSCREENDGEAEAVVEMVKALLSEGNNKNAIAVVTPFRKQVRLIRSKAKDLIDSEYISLIDTVERLQGQDVDCIILSFAASDDNYINEQKDFIFNLNRLNVMISRARTKVVIFGSKRIQDELKQLLKI